MAELYKTKRLKIVSAIFIALIIIGFLTFRSSDHHYFLSIEQTISEISLEEITIDPNEFLEVIRSGNDNFIFIDVRNIHDYLMGHVPNAVNVPLTEMLNSENLEYFNMLNKNDSDIIIYGNDRLQANGSLMFLKQMGIKNIKLLPSDFTAVSVMWNGVTPAVLKIEEQSFDETAIKQVDNTSLEIEISSPAVEKKNLPFRKVKKSITSGGC